MVTSKTRLMIEGTVRSVSKQKSHRVWSDPLCHKGKVIGRSIKYSGITPSAKNQQLIAKLLQEKNPGYSFEVHVPKSVAKKNAKVDYRGLRVLVRKGKAK
jgi:hypothetical protein